MEDSLSIQIDVPIAELEQLSFCESTREALTEWVGGLPMANTQETANQLMMAANEIARLVCDPDARLGFLESVRPTVHYLCARLDRSALTNANSGEPRAHLAQNLQTCLCVGYKAVIHAAIPLARIRKPILRDVLPKALHRCLSDMSRTLLRSLQMYVPAADNLWLEFNQIYLIAERLNLAAIRVRDSENHSDRETSVQDAYLRALLLAACKPNQLRHRNLTQVFNALEHWTGDVVLAPELEKARFVIDLAADVPPRYCTPDKEPDTARGLRTDVLTFELEAWLKDLDVKLRVPDYLDNSLIMHLINAWGIMQSRAFSRTPTDGMLKVCIGLRAAHFYLSGAVDFAEQLNDSEAVIRREVNPFLEDTDGFGRPRNSGDIWDQAGDLSIRIPENPAIKDPSNILAKKEGSETESAPRPGFQIYDTHTVDTSPSGYCIQWSDELPVSVQTGELLAVRDNDDPRWCISVIRWIRQDSNATSMGIELLAPRAIPIAVRLIQKRGGAPDFQRALLLPELKAIGQQATVITPTVPFQAGQKVHVQRQGIQTTAQLSENVLRTENFNQFTFRMLDGYLESAQIDLNMEPAS